MTYLTKTRTFSHMSIKDLKQQKLEDKELELKIEKIKSTYEKKVDKTADNIKKLTDLIEREGFAGVWFNATPRKRDGEKK